MSKLGGRLFEINIKDIMLKGTQEHERLYMMMLVVCKHRVVTHNSGVKENRDRIRTRFGE